MTVETNASSIWAQGNGATVAFPYNFEIPGATATDTTNVVVSIYDTTVTPAAVTILPAGTFTISGVGDPAGGLVDYPLAGPPLAFGQFIRIRRSVPYTQPTDIGNQSNNYGADTTLGLDWLEFQIQQIVNQLGFTLQIPLTDPPNLNTVLPAAKNRAGGFVSFDANGNAIIAGGATGGVQGLPFAVDSGLVNAYVANPVSPVSNAQGNALLVKIAHSATGASTLAVSGNAALPILTPLGANIGAGQLPAGAIVLLTSTGAAWQAYLLAGAVGAASLPYAADTGAVNAYVANPAQAVVLAAGAAILVKLANTNTAGVTLNASGTGVKAVLNQAGGAMQAGQLVAGGVYLFIYDGAAWQAQGLQAGLGGLPYAADTGPVNALVAAPAQAVTLAAGSALFVKIGHTNTAGATLNASATGATAIVTLAGAALTPGELVAGAVMLFISDGVHWQVAPIETLGATLPYAADTGAVNALIAAPVPAVSLAAGNALFVKIGHTNTAAVTLNASGTGAAAVVSPTGAALAPGAVAAGAVMLFVSDGVRWQVTPLVGAAPAPEVYVPPSGGDDTAAINAALGSNVIVKLGGNYTVSAALNLAGANCGLIGTGYATTKITSSVAGADVVAVTANHFRCGGFTLDRSAVAAGGATGLNALGATGDGVLYDVLSQNHITGIKLGSVNYGTGRDLVANFNYANGFEMTNVGALPFAQWNLWNCLAQGNNGWGMYCSSNGVAAQMTLLPWFGFQTYANTAGGVAFVDTVATPIFDITLIGCFLGTDNYDNLHVDVHGGWVRIADTTCELAGQAVLPFGTGRGYGTAGSNTGNGMFFGANTTLVQVDNCHVNHSSFNGIISHAATTNITNTLTINNSGAAASTYFGIDIHDAGLTATIVGGKSGNTGGASQRFGVNAADGTRLSLIGIDLTNNAVGGAQVLANAGLLQAWGCQGQANNPAGGTGTITGVTAGTGLTGGGVAGTVTLNLANTAVAPGAYTNSSVTIDAQGRVTAASSGSAGGGNVTGPGSSVLHHVAAFNNTIGTLLEDTGILYTAIVLGPGSATNQALAAYNGTTGKLLQDTGILAANVVQSLAASTNNDVVVFDTASGRFIKDTGILSTSLALGPASAGSHNVAAFNGTSGKLLEDTGILYTNLVQGPGSVVANNLAAFLGTTGKSLKDSGIAMPAGASLLASPGYCYLPGGLILEWGFSTVNAASTLAVALPLNFPTAALAALACADDGSAANYKFCTVGCTTTTITLNNAFAGGPVGGFWFALGY